MVDEHLLRSVVRLSYFLKPVQSDEVVEQDLIWTIKFTDEQEVDQVLITETVEFIDAAANARMGRLLGASMVMLAEMSEEGSHSGDIDMELWKNGFKCRSMGGEPQEDIPH